MIQEGKSGYYVLAGTVVIRTTRRAVLLRCDGEYQQPELWVPRSVCVGGEELDLDDEDIEIKKWWVEENVELDL